MSRDSSRSSDPIQKSRILPIPDLEIQNVTEILSFWHLEELDKYVKVMLRYI